MNDSTWAYFSGADGVPSNDTDPYLGAIADGGSQLNEDSSDATVLNSPTQPGSGSTLYYGGAYRKLLDNITANNCRMYNRAGCLLNSGAGLPYVQSTSPLDAGTLGNAAGSGLQVKATGKVSGVITSQWLNVNGVTRTSDVNGGAVPFDSGTVYRWEASLNGAPTTFYGDVAVFIGVELVGVIRGTLNPRRGIAGKGNQMISAEVQIAVASSKNTTVGATNRLTAPSGVSAFDSAVYLPGSPYWTGSDQSLAMPGNPYTQNDYCGYAVQFESIAGMPTPLGDFQADVGIICND